MITARHCLRPPRQRATSFAAIGLRLLDNATSLLEGAAIFAQLTFAGLALGVLWAGKEIFDTWTLE